MPAKARLLALSLTAFAALAAASLAALPGNGEAKPPRIPKIPKVTQYPITLDAAGYVEYRWTYDDREKCVPGYSKTVTEELTFELGRPRRARLQITGGTVVVFPVKGGQAALRTELSGFQTTNYCPPTAPVKIEEPVCRPRFASPLLVGIGTELSNGEELAPLGRQTLAVVSPARPARFLQRADCRKERPSIDTDKERLGWSVEPPALSVPTGIVNTKLWNLKPGREVRGTTRIGGGCGRASVTAHASAIPSTITSCTLTGRVVVNIKRLR